MKCKHKWVKTKEIWIDSPHCFYWREYACEKCGKVDEGHMGPEDILDSIPAILVMCGLIALLVIGLTCF